MKTAAAIQNDLNKAVTLHQQGALAEAEEIYRALLSQIPGHAAFLDCFGVLLLQTERFAEAEEILEKAQKIEKKNPKILGHLAAAKRRLQKWDEAAEYFETALKLAPKDWELWANYANLCLDQKQDAIARDAFEKVVALHPDHLKAHRHLAYLYLDEKDYGKAAHHFEIWLSAHADDHEALNDCGYAYLGAELYDKAESYFRRALPFMKRNYQIYVNHGMALKHLHKTDNAIRAFEMALSFAPDLIQAHSLLSDLYLEKKDFDKAYDHAMKVINHPDFHNMADDILVVAPYHVAQSVCDFENIYGLRDRVTARMKEDPKAFLSIALGELALAHTPAQNKDLFDRCREWGDYIAARAAQNALPPLQIVDYSLRDDQKLRIGFLSSDFKNHVVARFIIGLFRSYDRARFSFHCFAAVEKRPDAMQEKFIELADSFDFILEMKDYDAAQKIRDRQIDILFDLNGHTQGSRVSIFVHRAAPIQIDWLGYPFTTGLKEADYFLVDRYGAPTNTDCMTETPLLMKHTHILMGDVPDFEITKQLPVEKNGYITFGSLNNFYKYTPEMFAAWAQIMTAIPTARLYIARPEFAFKSARDSMLKSAAASGLDPDRIDLHTNEMGHFLHHYNQIDLCLDSFAITGGTTTCDAVSMGVPVISLIGEQMHQRISNVILQHCGAPELCCDTVEGYVEKAIALAKDLPRMKNYRQTLREKLRASPLFNEAQFVEDFQETMQNLAKKHKLIE